MNDALLRYRSLKAPRVVGLMSGTSADAIDAALVEMGPRARLLDFRSHPLPEEVRRRLQEVFDDRGSPREILRLHWLLGELFARAALSVMEGGADLVASHGQTIAHLPQAEEYCGERVRGTLQIGEGAVIARRTGCLTVCDFRPSDLAAGGQGAPLVPFADTLLFRDPHLDRLALNLGGMANLTWIPSQGEVEACDTGPGNSLMDALAWRATGKACDRGGALAARGRVLPDLLAELMAHPFLSRPAPKSTGREEFGRPLAERLWGRGSPEDLLRTAAAFTAASVMLHVQRFLRGPAQILVGGGGVENPVLMQELFQRMPARVHLLRMEDVGVPAQAREAVAFALLGHETAHGRPSNVPRATGASSTAILGRILMP